MNGFGDRFLQQIKNSIYKSYENTSWSYYYKHSIENCFPHNCNRFCPYIKECIHAKNIKLTVRTKKNTIVELVNENKKCISLDEASKQLEKVFLYVQAKQDSDVHVIKAGTGIGKSYTYIKYLENSDKPYIIAVPTHNLKEEILASCLKSGYKDRQ